MPVDIYGGVPVYGTKMEQRGGVCRKGSIKKQAIEAIVGVEWPPKRAGETCFQGKWHEDGLVKSVSKRNRGGKALS